MNTTVGFTSVPLSISWFPSLTNATIVRLVKSISGDKLYPDNLLGTFHVKLF